MNTFWSKVFYKFNNRNCFIAATFSLRFVNFKLNSAIPTLTCVIFAYLFENIVNTHNPILKKFLSFALDALSKDIARGFLENRPKILRPLKNL